MSLTIPQEIQARINLALASLPVTHGKVSLQIDFHCGTGGHVAEVKFLITTPLYIRTS